MTGSPHGAAHEGRDGDPVDFGKFTAREWAAGLRMAVEATSDRNYTWINPNAARALADFLSDLADRGIA